MTSRDRAAAGPSCCPASCPSRPTSRSRTALIAAIGPELEAGGEEIDARGLHVLPGAIDAHVHFNEPGRTDWEGWATGTAALAAGGATACVEMPLNAHPPTVDGAAFDAKVAAAGAAAKVDFALWGGLVPGPLERMDELAERGVAGFKAFMCDTGIDDFDAADDDVLGAGMERAAALGLPVARARGAARRSCARWTATTGAPGSPRARRGPSSPRSSARSSWRRRPAARCTSCTSRPAPAWRPSPRRARAASTRPARPARTTSRSTEDDLERLGTLAKCAPPLRAAGERDALWEQLGARADRARRLRPLAVPARDEGGRLRAAPGAGSPARRRRSRCCSTRARRRGLPLAPLADLVTGAPGAPAPAAQGAPGAGRRRRPRARRPARRARARPSPARPPPRQPVRGPRRCAPASCARCCAAAPCSRTAASRPARTAACSPPTEEHP